MGFGQESDVAFAEGITLQMRELLCMFYIVSVMLCFIGIMFEGKNYNLLYGFKKYYCIFITVVGMQGPLNWVYVTGWFYFWRRRSLFPLFK